MENFRTDIMEHNKPEKYSDQMEASKINAKESKVIFIHYIHRVSGFPISS